MDPTRFRRQNYRHLSSLQQLRSYGPATVISLFSIEPTGTPAQNHRLYRQIFRHLPSVAQILSAGFYYQRQWDELEPVLESGGLLSHQLNGAVPFLPGETRIQVAAPSKLFGRDVVEVWRYLIRP